MDALKNLTGGGKKQEQPTTQTKDEGSGGIMGSLNSALGGGKKSEQNEDALDKGNVDSNLVEKPPSY